MHYTTMGKIQVLGEQEKLDEQSNNASKEIKDECTKRNKKRKILNIEHQKKFLLS